MARRRLDTEIVRRGLADSRTAAQRLVDEGRVLVNGSTAERPARLVGPGEPLVISDPPPRFVSRGGVKLDAALDRFRVDVSGLVALDAGSSTGGFTDCLLQRGAAGVVAVDVGRGQLHERLKVDPRVRLLERTNVRSLRSSDVPGAPFPVVVADLSFISLRTVAPALVGLAAPHADVVALVKPQFEAGRRVVSEGRGVVADRAVWEQVILAVISAFQSEGATMMDVTASPLRGAEGNVEFLAHFRAHAGGDEAPVARRPKTAEAVAAAVRQAS